MDLPDFPEVPAETMLMIAERHGLHTHTFSRLPSIGVFNAIYALGDDFILRIGVPPSTEQKCTIVGLEAESRGFRGGSQYFCQRNP